MVRARRGSLQGIMQLEIEEPVSWVVGLAALAFAWGGLSALTPTFYLRPSFIAILAGFVVHEMAHKMVAIRYGLRAGFVAFGPGLLITFLSGVIPGLVILAPGYVRVVGYGHHPRAFLYSVASGPASNIILSAASILLLTLLPETPLDPYLHSMASINAYLAFFNLLPVPPLDGSKILRSDVRLWAVMMLSSIALLLLA